MNEETWLTTWDLNAMFAQPRVLRDDRQRRLFACACCRRLWSILTREECRAAVETAERYADGQATVEELRAGLTALRKERAGAPIATKWEAALSAAMEAASEKPRPSTALAAALDARAAVGWPARWQHSDDTPTHLAALPPVVREELLTQCALLRDIAGNPYRRVELDPAWLRWNDGTVRRVAQGIYEESAFSELPVLADALEEAGCSEATLLEHCRSAGPHVRGCWAVDLLLARR
jgi:hypothetical protein